MSYTLLGDDAKKDTVAQARADTLANQASGARGFPLSLVAAGLAAGVLIVMAIKGEKSKPASGG